MANKVKFKTNTRKGKRDRPFQGYMAKAFYASPKELSKRIPELQPLREKTIAVFGLGCLGAPSALEFVRAGVGFIRFVDYDFVDPATTVRWPIGFSAAGRKKTDVLSEFIRENYPYVQCDAICFKVGQIREPGSGKPPDQKVIDDILDGVDLIYDCTAELGVQQFLTDLAGSHRIPYIGLSGTLGAWGGHIFRIRPWLGTGCWHCYLMACDDETIPEPPSAPEKDGQTQPVGCADPTFTGAGFDILQVALMGVRMAVSTICEGINGAYPSFDWDAVHIRLRSESGSLIAPKFDTYQIDPNPECQRCHGKSK